MTISQRNDIEVDMGQFKALDNEYTGLTTEEALEKQVLYGPNTSAKPPEHTRARRIAMVFASPTFILLIAAAVTAFFLENLFSGVVSALLAAFFAFCDCWRIIKLDARLSDMLALSSIKYRVVRDDEISLVAREEIVPGDIIVLQAGESVPADCGVLESTDLLCDESVFPNGQAIAEKKHDDGEYGLLLSGSHIIRGNAVAQVTATGVDTRLCREGMCKTSTKPRLTALELAAEKAEPVTTVISVLVLSLFTIITLFGGKTIPMSLNFGLVAALAFTPVHFSAIVRIYYIIGALVLSRKNTLIKDLSAIEKLNSLSVMCIDKSGTVTKAQQEIKHVYSKNTELFNYILLLSYNRNSTDSVDRAISLYSSFSGIDTTELYKNENLFSYPFDKRFKISGNLWQVKDSRLLCVKGSPETVFPLCGLKGETLFKAQQRYEELAREGLTIIACAFCEYEEEGIPENLTDCKFSFMGLCGITNRIKEQIPAAVSTCKRAGLRVVLLTGDNPDSAVKTAHKIGIPTDNIITGEMLERGELDKIDTACIFASISPSQKADAVKALRDNGEIVAITGNTLAEAPVLLKADLGIASMETATGAAQEAATMLVSDDSFAASAEAIRTSRQLHRNIKKGMATAISASGTLIISVLLAAIFGWRQMWTAPLLGLFLTIILPALAIMFAGNSIDSKTGLSTSSYVSRGKINRAFIKQILIQAIVPGIAAFCGFFFMNPTGTAELYGFARTFAFIIITVAFCVNALINLTGSKAVFKAFSPENSRIFLVVFAVLALMLCIIYIPAVNTIFGLIPISVSALFAALITGILSTIWWETTKFFRKKVDSLK